MFVSIGNPAPVDAREEGGQKIFYAAEGNRTTTFHVPSDMGVSEALTSIIGAMHQHMQPGSSAVWVESDSPELQGLLVEHWRINPDDNYRPINWGQEG